MREFLANYGPEDTYLKYVFKHCVGYPLNLDNPQTFNEKIQWLKLNNRKPEYTDMVDKIDAKKYVESLIGSEYIIPTIGTWDSVDEIGWDSLPNQFVMKCSHDSGGIIVCKDKSKLNIEEARRKLTDGWVSNYYKYYKEYPYREVKPRLIAEEYMEDESGYELKDYKIFCFDGEPKFLFVATDRQKKGEEVKFDFFDLEWNHIPVRNGHENAKSPIPKPKNFELMLELARKLSKGKTHVRVDLYNCNGKIYFGELTFFHFSGLTSFVPQEWDYKFGEYFNLPIKNNE